MEKIEEIIINTLRNPKSARQIKYLALDLLSNALNINVLADLAKKHNIENRMGYLAEISAIAAKKEGLSSYSKLNKLKNQLSNGKRSWAYLEPTLPEYAKRIIADNPQTKYNRKWKVYSTLKPKEICDWVKLYGLKKNAPSLSRQGAY
ncbi:hypothetical protein KY348_00275 [Candidatus Woesearchaeota archaeon]|nr:hypothetical protein [Candidatus Woesearchaeota archaeon]